MLESRNSYGWGFVGSEEKGFEWLFQPDEKDPCYMEGNLFAGRCRSGYVYPTEAKATREGKAWLKSTEGRRSGTITAVKAEPVHFEY